MSRVLFDIDTQLDFLYPSGALYVQGAEHLVPAISRMNRWAAEHGAPVISTMDAHTENDQEFQSWPHHCVAGTFGQRKAESTLLEKRVVVPNVVGATAVSGAPQILLEKQSVNCFTAVNLAQILDELDAKECVVYGVVTEICVRHAALGLLRSGRKVELVTDVIGSLKDTDRDAFFQEFTQAGGTLTTSAAFA